MKLVGTWEKTKMVKQNLPFQFDEVAKNSSSKCSEILHPIVNLIRYNWFEKT